MAINLTLTRTQSRLSLKRGERKP